MLLKQILIENIFLPLGDFFTGSSFVRSLKELRINSRLHENELAQMHHEKLKKLLKHATENVPYYANYKPYDLNDFPILTKTILSENQQFLLSKKNGKVIRNASSGSTGQQSVVYWSVKEQSINRATQINWWEWAGYKLGDPLLQTGITPQRGFIKSIKDRLLNTYYLQAFAHNKDDIKIALEWARKQREPVLAGYASSLFVIASCAEELGIEVKFKTAICWGDKLFDHYRKKIEVVFNTKVHETYGSAEGLMMGAQHDLDKMYLMNSHVHVEILDDDNNPVEDGCLGHVIVTNLNGYAMPLIRYRIGDLGIKLPHEQYPQNKKMAFSIWQKIIGRDTDLVKTQSGKYMVVHSFTGIFEHIPEITQFCIIQEDLQGILIQYIPNKNFKDELLDDVKHKILNYLQEDFVIGFQKVDEILPTKSGKPQIIISKLNK